MVCGRVVGMGIGTGVGTLGPPEGGRYGDGMLLTIDVGNTNTVLGVFRGEELIANWRLTTARAQTVGEYGGLTRNLFSYAGLDQEDITGVMISSVGPPVNWTLAEIVRNYLGEKGVFRGSRGKAGWGVVVCR